MPRPSEAIKSSGSTTRRQWRARISSLFCARAKDEARDGPQRTHVCRAGNLSKDCFPECLQASELNLLNGVKHSHVEQALDRLQLFLTSGFTHLTPPILFQVLLVKCVQVGPSQGAPWSQLWSLSLAPPANHVWQTLKARSFNCCTRAGPSAWDPPPPQPLPGLASLSMKALCPCHTHALGSLLDLPAP